MKKKNKRVIKTKKEQSTAKRRECKKELRGGKEEVKDRSSKKSAG
jgi:hypothetical protein